MPEPKPLIAKAGFLLSDSSSSSAVSPFLALLFPGAEREMRIEERKEEICRTLDELSLSLVRSAC